MNAELSRNGELCPACGEGHLHSRMDMEQVEYKGQHAEVPLHFSACDYCGSELAGEAESLANKRAMQAFRKTVDGLLTGQEIRDFRVRLELSQELAASLFGGGKVAFSRYENDDVAQSTPMDRLIRVCKRQPAILQILAEEAGINLPSKLAQAIDSETAASLEAALKWELPKDYLRAYARAAEGLHQEHPAAPGRGCANDEQFPKYGQRSIVDSANISIPAWRMEMFG